MDDNGIIALYNEKGVKIERKVDILYTPLPERYIKYIGTCNGKRSNSQKPLKN